MSRHTHIVKRQGSANWYVRMRVPDELVHAYGGRKEIWTSTRTADRRKAEQIGARLRAELLDEFAAKREARTLTDDNLARFAREFYERELDFDDTERVDAMLDSDADAQREVFQGQNALRHQKRLNDQWSRTGDYGFMAWAAEDIIARYNLPIEIYQKDAGGRHLHHTDGRARHTDDFNRLCEALARADGELLRRKAERNSGNYNGQPTDVLLTANPQAKAVRNSDRALNEFGLLTLRELLEKRSETRRSMADSTKQSFKNAVRMFEEYAGPLRVCDIGKQALIAFADFLLTVPTNYTTVFKGKTIVEAVKANQELTNPRPALDPDTINDKYLSHVKTLISYAANKLGAIPDNPGHGISVERDQKKDRRESFTRGQLQNIFALDTFGPDAKRDSVFWAPIIALYTGARVQEIGQLECDDIKQEYGCWYFHLTKASDNEGSQKTDLKTKRSRRVPVHSELIKIGLLNYVRQIKEQGHVRLFPDWESDKKGKYANKGAGRAFNRTLLVRAGVNPPHEERQRGVVYPSFHSFRHTFKDACDNAGIQEKFNDLLTGHAASNVARSYGSGASIERLATEMNKVRFDFLDFTHLHKRELGSG